MTITHIKIDGVTFPYIQNTNPFQAGIIKYDDSGVTKTIPLSEVQEFITA